MSDSKQVIFNNFVHQYQALSNVIKSFPIPPNILGIILQNFDTGYLWTKEAFNFIEFDKKDEKSPEIEVVSDSIPDKVE